MRKLAFAGAILIGLFVVLGGAFATINSAANKTIALGNGSTTQFTFSFVGDQPGYISVIYTDQFGNQTTLTQGPGPTQYQLVLNPAVSPGLWGIGGTVTYDPSSVPIASGTTLTIIRELPFVQNISLLNLASLSALAQSAERGLDQLEMQIQQVNENITRVVAGPVSDPAGINYTLPAVAQRAGQVLCFDGSGNVAACSTAPSGTISSAMQPVVSAASLAAGRTAFGLGSMAVENINNGTLGGNSIQDDGTGNARVSLAITADSTNQTVTCNYYLTQRIATGPITYTLPQGNSCFNGFGFSITALPSGGPVTVTPNSTDNFAGQASGASFTIQPGGTAFVTENGASNATWYAQNGTLPISASSPASNLGLSASATSNALTLNVTTASGAAPSASSPVLLGFRSTTAANGASNLAAITSTLSVIIPAGATLGTSNTTPFRLWLFLAYNNGNPELVVSTCSSTTQIYGCGAWEQNLTTTTTISSGATSGGTPYTTAGRSADSLRLIGFCSFDAGLTTAGQWASACSKLQVFGPGVKRPGEVVQEIWANIPTTTTTNNTTLVASNVTASLTPTSTINLVSIDCRASTVAAANSGALQQVGGQVYRGSSTAIGQAGTVGATVGSTGQLDGFFSFDVLDAPAVNTSTAYTLYFASGATSHNATISNGTMRLKEIMG